jgi:hypothetical protein
MTRLSKHQALMAELCDREARRGHDRLQQGRAYDNGLFSDGESQRPAAVHEIRVCPQSAQHRVDIGAQLEVAGRVQAASTSFTRRTALEASSA